MGMKRASGRSTSARISVADSLFTKVQQRVLALLFGQPNRSFFANEIIKLAASGSGAVQRELERLEISGLVTSRRVGNQRHYQANTTAPVFPELRSLVLKTSGLADVIRSALARNAREISAAFVYGSVAKHLDTASSDIDLMVISDTLTYADLYAVLEVASSTLGRSVHPTLYTRAELKRRIARRNAFVSRTLEQPKIWIIGGDRDVSA